MSAFASSGGTSMSLPVLVGDAIPRTRTTPCFTATLMLRALTASLP